MPLGTLDRTPPPFFKQGPSALTKLVFFSALSLFLMVADSRFALMRPLRAGLATALYPVQWVVLEPLRLLQGGGAYFEGMGALQAKADSAERQLAAQSVRSGQVEQLTLENQRLRQLLELRAHITTPSQSAEVLYDAADAYTRKVVIDRGTAQGVVAGSPVLDGLGVLGQVTRAYPMVSEVTLLIDRDQAIPVLNTRTGARSVAYGDPSSFGGQLELRFMAGNSDVQVGDVLTTSGVDGVYPVGLQVAKIAKIERRADSAFARIYCTPVAQVAAARHVMVLQPVGSQLPEIPAAAPVVAPKKGAKK
ncbi:rod shape-determining protein MreC [Rhodoferax ferrireducens]|uniref:Cell shape-determining protein MreC n=1 Tax=Rhodoferax ferrireducens TaxID=192843 RepID=A0ABU2CCD1_9BURK|nr:rod shape-determining protein MreC [Rhodoferax ferrireducens]MDR7378989.1 rod shape-determining protein MreC [Rhodoferax ferrireducens]